MFCFSNIPFFCPSYVQGKIIFKEFLSGVLFKHYGHFFLSPSVGLFDFLKNSQTRDFLFDSFGCDRYEKPKIKSRPVNTLQTFFFFFFCCWKHVHCTHTFAWFEESGKWTRTENCECSMTQVILYVVNDVWGRLGLEMRNRLITLCKTTCPF